MMTNVSHLLSDSGPHALCPVQQCPAFRCSAQPSNVFSVLSELQGKGPEDGVWVYGMFLDGARWDKSNHKLAEARPKKLFNDMAYCHLKPAKNTDVDLTGKYTCPCYKTSERKGVLSTTGLSTNFVIAIGVESDQAADHWIRRGLAMLLSLDD